MQHTEDKKLKGHAFLAAGVNDLAETASKHTRYEGSDLIPMGYKAGIGYGIHRWADFSDRMAKPYTFGIDTVRKMSEALLASGDLPRPVTIRRRPRWSDADGEVDCDRAIRGDEEYMRAMHREHHHGPTTIALLLNVGGGQEQHEHELFWRGAAATALVDLLEEAGYACEVWFWFRGSECYSYTRNRECFVCWKAKDAGDPVDVDTLAKSSSGWFFRTAVLGTGHSIHYTQKIALQKHFGYCFAHPGEWVNKYIEVDAGVNPIHVPVAESFDRAIDAARSVLATVARDEILVNS